MRKVLILLVVFAVIGTAAFADGKFTAWNEGIAFLYAQVGSNAAQAGWGPNWDNSTVTAAKLPATSAGPDNEWTFGYDGKGYGFSASFEFSLFNTSGAANGLALGNAVWQWWGAYFKPFGDAVKFTLGAPRVDYVQWTYIEGFGAYTRFVNNDLSVTAEIKPVAGLTVGLVDFMPVLGSYLSQNSLNMGSMGTGANFDIANNFGVLASYSMDNLGTFTLQYKQQNPETSAAPDSENLGVGVNISAVKNIGINAGFNYNLISGLMVVDASAKASLSPILVEADVAYKQVSSSISSFAGEVLAEYDMGTMGVGAQIGYDDGNGVGLLGESASAAWDGFEIYPYVVANFDNASSFKLGFVYSSGANGHSSVIAVPVTYVWAF